MVVPDGVVWQTVVVVTGAVVGTVECVVADDRLDPAWPAAGAVAGGVVVVGVLVAGCAVAATNPIITAAAAPEVKNTDWAVRRTRDSRRSRSWGVRTGDLMASSLNGRPKRDDRAA